MATFSYKSRKGPQQLSSGLIEANTIAEAVSQLTRNGQIPIEVKPCGKMILSDHHRDRSAGLDYKISSLALFQFTRQLADLLEAGLPLARCMELLLRQRQFPVMLKIVDSIIVTLKQGGSLSAALAKYPQIFLPMYVHTVKAAESSGQLPLVLDRLAHFLEADIQMQSKVKSSLLYPVIILAIGFLTIFVLLSFVLPRLTMMFEDFDAELPFMTKMVVAASHVFEQFWWLMAALVGGVIWFMNKILRTSNGKIWMDGIILKIPLLKPFIENAQLSRFARTLGMLLESGVPIVTALESVVLVIDNSILQEEVRRMAIKVKAGMSLTQAIKASVFFPEMAVDLIAVGQESGKLEKGLYKLAENCERKSREFSQSFTTILGPAVLVMVAGIVGFMIIAMLLPMFQMNMMIN